MYSEIKGRFLTQVEQLKADGLYKTERIITSMQGSEIEISTGETVLNFCANNYLGLSSHPLVIEAAIEGLKTYGYGMSSVRFICGTQDIHKKLEQEIAGYFQTEDTILYAACFDANGGVFEPLLTNEDIIISDELNHASIIDGVRLCKAERRRYKHSDMRDLEIQLQNSNSKRNKIIVTDGVFSMDGDIAKLDKICQLAEKYNALTMIDECHAAGVTGKTGRGTTEYHDVVGKIDIITGTLGKAFGGAIGGFTTGRKEIIELLRQKSRPYLFSNSLPPAVVNASIVVFNIIRKNNSLLKQLKENASYFIKNINQLGFDTKPTESAIVAVMLYDAKLSQVFAEKLLEQGIYAIGFYYPVVPQNQARIRIQLSAAHTTEQLDKTIAAFGKVGKELNII